jgi:hypothetical protein
MDIDFSFGILDETAENPIVALFGWLAITRSQSVAWRRPFQFVRPRYSDS